MLWAGGMGEDVLAKFTSSVSLDNKGHGWVGGKRRDRQVREEMRPARPTLFAMFRISLRRLRTALTRSKQQRRALRCVS